MRLGMVPGNCLHGLAVTAVLLGGFLLRLYASTTIPLMQSEQILIRIAEELSFNPHSLDLKGSGCNDHPLLQMYLLKASSALCGDTPAGWRFLNVCVGSLGLLAVYSLARMLAGRGPALAAMILAAVNQFHVAWSRIAVMETLFLTAAAVSLILFWYGLQTGRRWAVLLNGLVLGVGFLAKESMLLLPICYFLFLVLQPRYRPWLRRPCVYAALLLALATVSHEIYWNLTGASMSLRYVARQAAQAGGISLRGVSFFLGELIEPLVGEEVWGGHNRGEPRWFPGWYEWPMMHWAEGLLLLGSTLTFCRRGRTCWQNLLLTVFFFTALFTMLIYTRFLFVPFYFSALCLIPAVIFAGCRLAQAYRRPWGRIAMPLLLVYLAVHLVSFVQIDHSYYKPPPLWRSFWYRSPKVTIASGGDGIRAYPPPQRMILLGIDGTTAETLERMIRQGKMPHLAALLRSGARAEMRVSRQSLRAARGDLLGVGPVFWTSIVTGCSPGTHRLDSPSRVLSTYRRVPALWNVNDYLGLRSVVTSVPGTYPAELLWGRMVSGLPDRPLDSLPVPNVPRLAYPRSLLKDVPSPEAAHPVAEPPGDSPATVRAGWQVAVKLAGQENWTLRAHVFTVKGHGQLASSGHDGFVLAETAGTYEAIDEQLESVRAELDGRTWLVLVAARGKPPQSAGAAADNGRNPYGDGLLLIAGPGVRRGADLGQVTPLDVAPTILYALGLPVFEHLEGEVLRQAFSDEFLAAHPLQTAPPCAFDRGWEFIDLLGLEAAADDALP